MLGVHLGEKQSIYANLSCFYSFIIISVPKWLYYLGEITCSFMITTIKKTIVDSA